MTKTENNILLFSITLCWSSSYVFIKDLPASLSSYGYITMTCGISAILLSIVFFKQFKNIKASTVLKGALLSLLLTANLLFEKKGIVLLPSSTASALAACSILIVPIILLIRRKRPTKNQWLGAIIIVLGFAVISGFNPASIINIGAIYMLLAAIMTAFYTIVADKTTKEENPVLLSVVQMWFCAISGFILWLIEDPQTFANVEFTNQMLSSVFILAFFSKTYAYVALMVSQKYTDPISVTIIASTEPIVTLILAVLIPTVYSEELTAPAIIGAAIIMLGAIASKSNFLKGKEKHD